LLRFFCTISDATFVAILKPMIFSLKVNAGFLTARHIPDRNATLFS